MLVYEFRNRVLYFMDEARPSFPAELEISTKLAPPAPFGDGVGNTRTTAGGAEIVARVSPSTGRFLLQAREPLFDPLLAGVEYATGSFTIKGRIATVRTTVNSMQEVANLLGALSYLFPAALNLEICDAPYSLYTWGVIGGVKFEWHYHAQELTGRTRVASKASQEQNVVRAWQRVDLMWRSPRIFMSLHYFRTACRLLMSGQHRFEFMGEAVLNLAKCLQALGGNSRDAVRDTLRQLDFENDAIEALYIPAMVLRDSFNVAHINLTQYSRDQLRTIHTYVEHAEDAFRDLLKRALEYYEVGRFAPASHVSVVGRDEAAALKRLAKNLAKFEAVATRDAVYLNADGSSHPAFAVKPPVPRRGPPPDV